MNTVTAEQEPETTIVIEDLLFELSNCAPLEGKRRLRELFVAEPEETNAFAFRLVPKKHVRIVGADEGLTSGVSTAGDVGADLLNWIEDRTRRHRYQRQKKIGKVRIVAEGDSWFQHPLLADIVDHLEHDFAVRSLGTAGDELSDILEQNDIVGTIRSEKPAFLLLSAGGNDTIGVHLAKWLRKAGQPGPEDGFMRYIDRGKFGQQVETLATRFQRIFDDVMKIDTPPHILVHGYDHAIPVPHGHARNRRVSGAGKRAWLSGPLNKAKVANDADRQAICRNMVDVFNTRLGALCDTYDCVHYVDLRGTLTETHHWFDELHPDEMRSAELAGKLRAYMDLIEGRRGADARTDRRRPPLSRDGAGAPAHGA